MNAEAEIIVSVYGKKHRATSTFHLEWDWVARGTEVSLQIKMPWKQRLRKKSCTLHGFWIRSKYWQGYATLDDGPAVVFHGHTLKIKPRIRVYE